MVKGATMLGTGERLRRLAATLGVEYAGIPGECGQGGEGARGSKFLLLSETTFLFRPLYNFFAVKQSKNSEK